MTKVLNHLAQQLKESFDAQDWENVSIIDRQVREEFERAISDPLTEIEQLRAMYNRFEKIYALISRGASKHRQEISDELKKITRENKVANTYLNSSQYKG